MLGLQFTITVIVVDEIENIAGPASTKLGLRDLIAWVEERERSFAELGSFGDGSSRLPCSGSIPSRQG